MYSPKIDERFIPELWKLAQIRRKPMTHLVADAVERYLAAERLAFDDRLEELGAVDHHKARHSRVAA